MKLSELKGPTRDEVLARIKNAKTKEEKLKWAAYLVQNRYGFYNEKFT